MSGPSRTAMLTVYPVSSDSACRNWAATRVISIELIAANPRSTTRGPSEYFFVSGSCCTYPSLASVATYRYVVLLFSHTARARSAMPSTGRAPLNEDRICRPRSSDCEYAVVDASRGSVEAMRHGTPSCFSYRNTMLTSCTPAHTFPPPGSPQEANMETDPPHRLNR